MALRATIPQPRGLGSATMDSSLPIVNIVLLLIFYFLATGQLLTPSEGGVDLALTEELPTDELPSPILVIRQNGEWTLDGQPVSPNLLEPGLGDSPVVNLLMDREAAANDLLDVLELDAIRTRQVRLVTVHKEPQQ